VILLVVPASFFDTGQTVCVSKLLAGIECYACGMTRAIMHLVHLDFEQAYAYNKLSFIVFPLISYLWGQELLKEIKLSRNFQAAQKTV
jgi:hypothetical protein